MRDLIGRGAELEQLEGHLTRLAAGDGAVVAVVGAAGIGKTHLADAAASRASAQGIAVHWGSGWPGPGAPALWPWIQILRSLGSELPSEETEFALFDEMVRRIEAAADAGPVLVVIDDLHLADDASVLLLELLARQRRGHALGILITYRPGEASPALARVSREADVLHLAALDPPSVAELVAAAAPALGPPDVQRLIDASGGNPLFVLELARALASGGPGAVLPLPATIAEVVDYHLDLVDLTTREVLAAAAIQGATFDVGVVAAASGTPMSDVARALEQAASVGLVTAPSHNRFVHALTAEAVLRHLPAERRQLLHHATAHHLADPEAVASHHAAAGAHCPPDVLLAASRRAAEVARSRFAHAEVARHLGAAIDAARRLDDVALLVDLLIEQVEAHKLGRDVGAARRAGLEAAEIARAAGDDERFVRVALAMPPDSEGIEVDRLADPEQIALREEALVRLPRAEDPLAARLMASLAMSLYWVQRTGDRAADHRATALRRDQLTATAIETVRRSPDPDPDTLAFCLAARLYALWGPDAPTDRSALVAELVEVAAAGSDGGLLLQALGWSVVDAMVVGDHARTRVAVDRYEQLATARRDPIACWTARRWQASVALLEGRLADAEALAAEALTLGSEAIDPATAVLFYAVPIGYIRFLQGRLGEAFAFVQEQAHDPANVPAWRAGYVLVAHEAGQRDLAARELQALAADRFSALPRDLDWRSSLAVVAPAVADLGDADAATALIELLEPWADEHALVGLGYTDYGPVRRVLALARVALGDRDGAIADLRQCLRALDPAHRVLRELCQRDLDRLLGGARAAATLRRDGERWLVGRGGPLHGLRPLRGLPLLHELLRRAGTDVPALELLATIEPPGDAAELRRAVGQARGEPLLDDRARADYARRIGELRATLDAADRAAAVERSEEAARELAVLEAELARATGLGGRGRRAPDAVERARTSVTKLLRRAIAAIEEVDAPLGAHLGEAVTTGAVCRYDPTSGHGYDWTLEGS